MPNTISYTGMVFILSGEDSGSKHEQAKDWAHCDIRRQLDPWSIQHNTTWENRCKPQALICAQAHYTEVQLQWPLRWRRVSMVRSQRSDTAKMNVPFLYLTEMLNLQITCGAILYAFDIMEHGAQLLVLLCNIELLLYLLFMGYGINHNLKNITTAWP